MPLSRAEIATPSGARLINRLCKHWAHKLEVEHSEQDAKIVFASGTCLMHAEPDRLAKVLEVGVPDRSLHPLDPKPTCMNDLSHDWLLFKDSAD